MVEASGIRHDKSWFVNARTGNIKDEYFFEKKLGSGGYGAVYLAKNKQTGKFLTTFLVDEQTYICPSELAKFFSMFILKQKFVSGVKVAVKAMQKGKITDYESFQNEINILMNLVSDT